MHGAGNLSTFMCCLLLQKPQCLGALKACNGIALPVPFTINVHYLIFSDR